MSEESKEPQKVTVVNFEMGFWSMVEFLVKLTFAAIPAAIVIAVVVTTVIAVMASIFKH